MAQERRSAVELHSLREQITQRWVQRRLGKIGHERRVCAIATTMFDLMQEWHALESADRRLLRLAALVHDVGRSIDNRRHPALGAEMIMEDAHLPVNRQERRRLAYLTRYHRGAVPQVGFDGILRSGDSRKTMRRILALLRAADTLDNRNITPPRLVIALKGRKLRVTCFIEEDCSKARRVFARRKKFRLLEDLLDCKVEVQIKLAQAVQAL
jgi:exopolyphosphatase/guanosine-5'-triphosphate,3'-diphosphate pyrophosphatase